MPKKAAAFAYFHIKSSRNAKASSKVPVYICKFCGKEYALHATRMTIHLVDNCDKCPEHVKLDLRSELKSKSKLKYRHFKPGRRSSTIDDDDSLAGTSISTLGSNSDVTNATFVAEDSNDTLSTMSSPPPPLKCNSQDQGLRSSSTSTSTRTRLHSFLDHITDDEHDVISKKLAMAIYASGTPLNITENKYWIDLFKRLRPSFTLPSRFVLSTSLLTNVYDTVKNAVNELLSGAKFIGIQCDCWSNIRREGIINFIITTPKPVFLQNVTN